MKQLLTAAGLLAVALTLTACGPSDPPVDAKPSSTVTVTETPDPTPDVNVYDTPSADASSDAFTVLVVQTYWDRATPADKYDMCDTVNTYGTDATAVLLEAFVAHEDPDYTPDWTVAAQLMKEKCDGAEY